VAKMQLTDNPMLKNKNITFLEGGIGPCFLLVSAVFTIKALNRWAVLLF